MFHEEVLELCKKLKPVIGKRADALWLAYATSDNTIDKLQVEAMIQAVAAKNLSSSVDDTNIFLPPPTSAEAKGEFDFGDVLYSGTPLFPLQLTRENFQRHIGIFAITGAGKTNVCHLMIRGLLKADVPFMVVDWKRSYRKIDDERIQVYSVGRRNENTLSWNPLRPPAGVHPRSWISVIAEVLEKSHLSGPGAGDIFLELLDKRFEKGGFYEDKDSKIYPNFFDIKEDLAKLTTRGRRSLWQDTAERIVRTLTFGPAAGAFNARNPIMLETLLNKPVIFELDQELPRSLRTFFSEVILRWVHLHRLYEGESSTLKHVLIIEEIHNLFPKNPFEKNATSGLETLARELRSFGQSLVAISQHPSLLPTYLLGNTNTLVFMALQHADDVEAARKALFLERWDDRYFGALKVGEGIVRIQGRVNPCHVRFPLMEE